MKRSLAIHRVWIGLAALVIQVGDLRAENTVICDARAPICIESQAHSFADSVLILEQFEDAREQLLSLGILTPILGARIELRMLDQTAFASLKTPENRLISANLGAVAMTDNRCSRLTNLARILLSASDIMQVDTLFSTTETPTKPATPSALGDSLRRGFEDYVATVTGGCFDDPPPGAFSREGLGSKANARDFWGFIDRYRGPGFAQLPLAMIGLAHDDQSLLGVFEANFPDEKFADVGGTSMLLVKWARARLGLKNQPLFDWQVPASTLPRRLSVRDVAVGAVAAIRIDLDRRPKNETIQLALDWDANVYFRWHLVMLDPTGAPIDDQNAPPLFAGSHLVIDARHLETASAIVILGANIGEKWLVLDPQSPPHGFEASVW